MKTITVSVIQSLALLVTSALLTTNALAQVGSCVGEMVNVYDHECEKAELKSQQCTTRIEQTPESRWCCCDADYPLSQCSVLFDSIFKSSKSSSQSKIMADARNFRTNVLAKNKRGQKYIKLYYSNIDGFIELFAKHPKLAKQTAQVINDNQMLMAKLTNGKRVKVTTEHMIEVFKLLKEYIDAAGKNSKIAKSSYGLAKDLTNVKWLNQLGIAVPDNYLETLTSQSDTDDSEDPPKDDDPTTCDDPKGGMCPRQPKDGEGNCPEGCNPVNATECSCKRTGPEGSGKTNPPTTETPDGDGGNDSWLCTHLGFCW